VIVWRLNAEDQQDNREDLGHRPDKQSHRRVELSRHRNKRVSQFVQQEKIVDRVSSSQSQL